MAIILPFGCSMNSLGFLSVGMWYMRYVQFPGIATQSQTDKFRLMQWCSYYTRAHMGLGPGEFLSALVNHVRSTYLNAVV